MYKTIQNSQPSKLKNKKLLVLILAIILILVIVITLFIYIDTRPLMLVNGTAVSEEEFAYFRDKVKAQVLGEVAKMASELDQDSVWDTELQDGSTALELLAVRTQEAVTAYKILVQKGVENGLTSEAQQPFYKNNLDKMSSNTTIYGPETKSPEMVVSEYVNSLTNALTDKLFDNATQEELEQKLQLDKGMYSDYDDFKIRPIFIAYDESGENSDTGKEKTRSLMQSLLDRAVAGEDFKSLVDEYSMTAPGTGMIAEDGTMAVIAAGNIARPLPTYLKSELTQVKNAGEFSGVFDTGTGWMLFQVVDRKAAKEPTLEEVGPAVELFLKDEKMETQMKDWLAQAETEVNAKAVARFLQK